MYLRDVGLQVYSVLVP